MQGGDELAAKHAFVRHLLVRAAGGQKLAHGFGGFVADTFRYSARHRKDRARKTAIEQKERVFGLNTLGVHFDHLHVERVGDESDFIFVRIGRVYWHDIAHFIAIGERQGVAVA